VKNWFQAFVFNCNLCRYAEEVSAAGRHVKGVVLARDLPHLSHLAIRARQEKVPLAATEDKASHQAAKYLVGQQVALNVTPNGVSLAPATEADVAAAAAAAGGTAGPAAAAAATPVEMTPVELTDTLECRPLSEASLAHCGAKATICGELVRVAERVGTFKAPAGVFIPFGAMEACVVGAGKADDFATGVVAAEAAAVGGDPAAIEAACASLRQLIGSVPFPPALAAQLAAAFPNSADGAAARVVVRSSANVEDLAGMSAAGLYESVLGVSAGSAAELGEAVTEVWASLYSRRAVLARRAAGVPQAAAHMAVLVQEMAPSRVSFVLHTAATSGAGATPAAPAPIAPPVVTPVGAAPVLAAPAAAAPSATLEAEVAVGLGETLASGARGSPWRLEVDQATGVVRTTAVGLYKLDPSS
jgi:phosphoglucan,water dikinase